MKYDFKNRVYIVTGGTSGIGKEISYELLQANADVVIVYAHNDEAAENTKEEFSKYSDHFIVCKCDVSNDSDVSNLFENVRERYGKLDGLINCAAYDKVLSIQDLSTDEYRHELNVNLVGPFNCIKNAISLLKNSACGRVINIASRLGTRPMPDSLAYCTSKAGLIMLSQCAALELSEYNIRVNTVSPSLTMTPLGMQSYSEEEIKQTAMKNPTKRLGKPEDIASCVLFLLSDDADYINGENINVNGGILLK